MGSSAPQTNKQTMQPKRGHLVVIKMGVDPFFSDPEMEANQRFRPGDEGRVVSRTKNGWLRIRICRTGWVVRVRNGPTRIDKPFETKCLFEFTTKTLHSVSHAWWLPVNIEKENCEVSDNSEEEDECPGCESGVDSSCGHSDWCMAGLLTDVDAMQQEIGYRVHCEPSFPGVKTNQMYLPVM